MSTMTKNDYINLAIDSAVIGGGVIGVRMVTCKLWKDCKQPGWKGGLMLGAEVAGSNMLFKIARDMKWIPEKWVTS